MNQLFESMGNTKYVMPQMAVNDVSGCRGILGTPPRSANRAERRCSGNRQRHVCVSATRCTSLSLLHSQPSQETADSFTLLLIGSQLPERPPVLWGVLDRIASHVFDLQITIQPLQSQQPLCQEPQPSPGTGSAQVLSEVGCPEYAGQYIASG